MAVWVKITGNMSTHLLAILSRHVRWLASKGDEADRANLSGMNLRLVDLSDADLREAILDSADLTDANLSNCRLDGASCRDTIFSKANLEGCSLTQANLGDAHLAEAKGLSVRQLAGSTLTGAQLPAAIADFKGLGWVDELSNASQRLLAGLLLASSYCFLTVATTTDVSLFTNSHSSKLPIIATEVPIVIFYALAPFALLSLYFYFHVYLQRLWESLTTLPAIFPDGVLLRQRINPWFLNGFIFSHLPGSNRQIPALSGLQIILCVALAWWLVPLTIAIMWIRYVRAQDMALLTLYAVLLGVAFGSAQSLHDLAVRTLSGLDVQGKRTVSLNLGPKLLGTITFVAALSIALGAHYLPPPPLLLRINLENAEVSTLLSTDHTSSHPDDNEGSGGRGRPDPVGQASSRPRVADDSAEFKRPHTVDLELVRGAHLSGLNLQSMRASGAFLVNSDLRYSNLIRAHLNQADLRGVNLGHAELGYAQMSMALLNKASLRDANLFFTDLQGADLRRSDLFRAKLAHANLSNAHLEDTVVTADLYYAVMKGTKLRHAILSYSNLTGAALDGADLTDSDLSRAIVKGATLVAADVRGAQLIETNLTNADLRWARFNDATKLTRAQLKGADLRDAQGLSKNRIDEAFLDATTQCPDELVGECGKLAEQQGTSIRRIVTGIPRQQP
jgi:uncharacterized protein YjbI with pentapeptide repeats